MRRLLGLIAVLLFLPAVTLGQDQKGMKVMIFPIKVKSKSAAEAFSNDLAAVLGAELSKEEKLEIATGKPFLAAVQEKKVDPARLARIAERHEIDIVIWGDVSKLEEGYSLELWAVGPDPAKKPNFFSATGKNMEDLIGKIKNLAVEIGTAVLKRPKIGEIKIEGNKRVENEAILNKLDLKPGAPFRRSALAEDIREIYSLGYFEDVQIRAEETAKGEVDLHIILTERPYLKELNVRGNTVFSKDEILDTLTQKSKEVVSAEKVRNDIAKIKQMYEKKGYYQPKIDYEIKELDRTQADLTFKIDEGQKSYLTEIQFDGNKKISSSELKKIMSVKEKSWFWFVDDSGTFTSDKLEENRMRLFAYYLDNGYITAQVGAPEVNIQGAKVKVTYPIREGNRYQVRKVDVTGDLIVPREALLEKLKTKERTWFKRGNVADDIKDLTKIYNDMGYAYADVEPIQNINDSHPGREFLDLTYRIRKGERVTI